MAIAALVVGLALCGTARATLIDRGGGLIYDDVLDVTWIQDVLSGPNALWADAVDWADTLSYGGYDDWRLPSMDRDGNGIVVDCFVVSELACRDNELGYMYWHNVGGTIATPAVLDESLIHNVSNRVLWSGDEIDADTAWAINYFDLFQGPGTKDAVALRAWGVRDGDSVSAVPAPSTLALAVAGLMVVGLRRSRKRGGVPGTRYET